MSNDNYDDNIINANGLVTNGELSFGIKSKLSSDNLARFSSLFKEYLESIVTTTESLNRSYLTTSDIGRIISQDYLDRLQDAKEIRALYKANSLQQGFIYHALKQGRDDNAYKVQLVFNYRNKLEAELLRQSWQGAINKYPSLRLRFAWDEELVQIVDKHQDLDWRYSDLSTQSQGDKSQNNELQNLPDSLPDNSGNNHQLLVDDIIKADRHEPYELESGNLLRIHLIKLQEDEYSCIISSHHAILDGWSNPVLLGFVHELYQRLLKAKTKAKRIQILNAIEEETSYIKSQEYLQQANIKTTQYWAQEVALIDSYPDLSGLLNLEQRTVKLNDYKLIKIQANKEELISGINYQRLKEFSQANAITINAILQYAWHRLLSVYGNSNTTVVGTTISGRNLPIDDIESSVGLYINTLPLIIVHRDNQTILEALQVVQDKINNLNEYSNVSLAKLQHSGTRLFDSLFVYENYPIPKENKDSIIKLSFNKAIEELDYPLGLVAYEANDEITVRLKYAGELFSEDTITELLHTLTRLVSSITKISDKAVSELSYLDEVSYTKVITTWNKTDKDYPDTKTIHELFEEQVLRTPDNIAVVYEGTKLTYKELNYRANQLANYLRTSYQIKGDDLILLCLDRSEQMLIAILATLKAGAGYVPMDPEYPDERIAYILEDTKSQVILTNAIHHDKLEAIVNIEAPNKKDNQGEQDKQPQQEIQNKLVDIISVDGDALQTILVSQASANLEHNITSRNLAYVIYTSGTTGKPKGVMIEHRGVINLSLRQA